MVEQARIICDTNPDIPRHWFKTDYIDNHTPAARIKSFTFTINDNTFLAKGCDEAFKSQTPKGMFYDRDILDLWVTDEGIVYSDFNKDTMIVDSAPNNLTYYVGVDWEVEHKNSIVVFGDNDQQNTYLLEAYVGKY